MKVKFLDGTERDIANLWSADLRDADLWGANLRGANVWGADLRDADLRDADLRGANLRGADLRAADLRSADLRDADLRSADLRAANLWGANLRDANLRDANLRGAKGLAAFSILPAGTITVFKKLAGRKIVTLTIPQEAQRVNAYGSRKCRAEYAIVVSGEGTSSHDESFTYTPGQIVRPDSFDPDPRVECSHGIHFFITREEAEAY